MEFRVGTVGLGTSRSYVLLLFSGVPGMFYVDPGIFHVRTVVFYVELIPGISSKTEFIS